MFVNFLLTLYLAGSTSQERYITTSPSYSTAVTYQCVHGKHAGWMLKKAFTIRNENDKSVSVYPGVSQKREFC